MKLGTELLRRSEKEAFGKLLGLEAVEVSPGRAVVRMHAGPHIGNIFGGIHGGALFSLIDEAFQLACNTHGTLAVALNVSITYVAAPLQGATLEATAEELHKTNRTASYLCRINETESGKLIATAQALAYRTGKKIEELPSWSQE
jgi:acyl-CoA thioesterase